VRLRAGEARPAAHACGAQPTPREVLCSMRCFAALTSICSPVFSCGGPGRLWFGGHEVLRILKDRDIRASFDRVFPGAFSYASDRESSLTRSRSGDGALYYERCRSSREDFSIVLARSWSEMASAFRVDPRNSHPSSGRWRNQQRRHARDGGAFA